MAPASPEAPFRAQDPHEINHLVQSLESHSARGKGNGGFSVKSATFNLPDGRSVQSWRMQDWDYKKNGLPTYARGLFTWINPSTRNKEIVIRGYDKFFNHGEIRKTEWDNVIKNTRGPYELSVKENGCIIFIGALDDESLLVCSKHSTGARGDTEKSHAIAGERWLEKHLKSVGKTKGDLAKQLRKMNVTAVAELCDDAFEEHVLAYTPDMSGLYLHGLNLNLPEFATYPHQLVDEFAQEWGMRKVTHIIEDDIEKVKAFLDKCAETGAYGGRDTEGFVIRCQATETRGKDWHDWFFKYKFEEPYLMYRQWRECTKAVISGKPPKYKKHKQITEEYLLFARRRLAMDSKLGKAYNDNHGIIKLRDDFLASKGLTGADVIQNEIKSGDYTEEVTNDVLLVPIATIGCGKTTLGVALCKLFGWGQFQNDNVEGKGSRASRFVSQCTMLLAENPVVFADRNNHQKRERAQFIDDVTRIAPKATFVALHWVHDRKNLEQIRQNMRERVLNRGDNHQTIHAGSKSRQEVVGIMDGFIGRFQPADPTTSPDADFDLIIDLDPLLNTRENLETVISRLNSEYPKLFPENMPTASDLDNAIEYAMNAYKPDLKHDLGSTFSKKQKTKQLTDNTNQTKKDTPQPVLAKKGKKAPKVEYFGVRVSTPRVHAILEAIFKDMPAERAKLYLNLSQSRRLQSEFHVTLIHRAQESKHAGKWKNMSVIHETKTMESPNVVEPTLGEVGVLLERVIWDERIMCFVVRIVPGTKPGGDFESVNNLAHITCGTASKDVKPKESNDLLERWLEGGPRAQGIEEEKVKGSVVLDGVVKGVMQKF
jgi:tRNA ligase